MYFRTRVWQCLKGNQSKITNHYQYIIYAGSKSWETSLTSHLNFQPQISSMESIIINTWLLGKQSNGTTAWSQGEESDCCCAALLTSAKGKQEAFVCLGSVLSPISFGAELCTSSRPQRTGLWALLPSSPWPLAPGLLPPSSSAEDWTLVHAALRLWNASDLASETIKITNYRAQGE